jgi:hypothetical protein
MGQTGPCALCLDFDMELQASHFMPAGIYRLCKTADTSGNPSPLLVSKGVVVQTDYQQRAHLLCRACEQRFNKFGESWVFANGIQKHMPTFDPFVDERRRFHSLQSCGSFNRATLAPAPNSSQATR